MTGSKKFEYIWNERKIGTKFHIPSTLIETLVIVLLTINFTVRSFSATKNDPFIPSPMSGHIFSCM